MALISTSNAFNSSGDITIQFNNLTKLFMIFTMIIGSLSINLHYKSFSHGFLNYIRNKNIKITLIFMLIFILTLSTFSFSYIKMPFIDKFINICFLIISFITTTGLIPEKLLFIIFINEIHSSYFIIGIPPMIIFYSCFIYACI